MQPTRHITFLTTRFWPDRHGGLEQRMWHVTRELAARGIAVDVLTENRTDAAPSEWIDGVFVRRFAPLRLGRLWRWREVLRVNWWRSILRDIRPDGIVWATDPMAAVGALAAGYRRELVFNPAYSAAAMDRCGRAYDAVSLRCSATLKWLDRLGYRLARHVVVSSHNVAQQFTEIDGPRDLHVIPHGSPPLLGRPSAAGSASTLTVGFVGRLDPCKDLPFVFRALRDVQAAVKLIIVGEGEDRPRLERIAAELGVMERVEWRGSTADPAAAYTAMDLLALPSYYEAFGNVVLEAMASGVPVIARRRCVDARRPVLTASEELISDGITGRLVESHDPRDLAAVLTHLAAHREELRRMSAAAHQHAAAQTWANTVESYGRVLGLPLSPAHRTPRAAA